MHTSSYKKYGLISSDKPSAAIGRLYGHLVCAALSFALFAIVPVASAQTAQVDAITSPRLGVPEVFSPMGAPLWIKIPVDATDAVIDAASGRFSLGPRPVNAGIPFIENAEVTFERQAGKHFLVIRSRQPVNELAIGLVVREQLTRGIRSREFTVLLDPPVLFEAIVAARNADASQQAAAVQASAQTQPLSSISPPVSTPVQAEPSVRALRPPRANRPALASPARRPIAAESAIAPAGPAVVAATSTVTAIKNQRAQLKADAKAASRKPKADAPLRLSLSAGDLATLPTANESTRAELRRRQLILDTDNLMSALLERNHKISLLEKELAGLAARISAAERTLNIPNTSATSDASGSDNVAASSVVATSLPDKATQPASPPTSEAVAAAPTSAAPAATAMAAVESAKAPATNTPPQQSRSTSRLFSEWGFALLAVALLSILLVALLMAKRRRNAQVEAVVFVPQEAEAYVQEVLSPTPTRVAEMARDELAEHPIAISEPVAAPTAEVQATAFPEIQFELPETTGQTAAAPPTSSMSASRTRVEGTAGIALHLPSQAANSEALPVPEGIRGRRMRYLQSRYHDIAILKPPLDAPQRLLNQASRIHDEGAVDYAKRLLKYAAYSRPYTEEFWLGLLELLYREKFANDYLVNARWFREYHPASANWDEVQRIGYLLDPAAPLFSSAAAWSHEEPILGTWLPVNLSDSGHATVRQHLKLELAG